MCVQTSPRISVPLMSMELTVVALSPVPRSDTRWQLTDRSACTNVSGQSYKLPPRLQVLDTIQLKDPLGYRLVSPSLPDARTYDGSVGIGTEKEIDTVRCAEIRIS